jgi:hypothetical protein
MSKPTAAQERVLWLAYFMVGLAFPLILWNMRARKTQARHNEIDNAHDTTVEDSFPASDPPSSW